MDIGIICFTMNGLLLAERVETVLKRENTAVSVYTKSRYIQDESAEAVREPLGVWTKKMFESKDGIIFIGASGIAVRAIAPYVESKKYDPAVIVMDEKGRFCISLLSGHLGGANELVQRICAEVDATPVITTATDVNERFAVDVFAKKNNLHISNMSLAKEVSAKLLHGGKIGFMSEIPYQGELPEGLVADKDNLPLGIYVGLHYDRQPFEQTLWLIPRCITAGIGCRRGTDRERIEELFEEACQINGIFHEAVRQVATIDLKKDEPGLLSFCEEEGFPLLVYTADELLAVKGDFTPSEFVQSVTGVDNVCERSAVKASGNAALIQKKIGKNGVTTAFAMEDWSVKFE